jgi:hypothetical protein
MAEDKLNQPRASQKNERMIEQGDDGFMDGQTNGSSAVGTHTPGTHQRSETVRANSEEGTKQTHENRENPLKDHVPGHLGYSMEDVKGVTPASGPNDAELDRH